MSVLSDNDIVRFVRQRSMIDPFDSQLVQPASYDVRLADKIMVPHFRDHRPVDLADRSTIANRLDEIDISAGYMLGQGRFVLGSTIEYVRIPNNIVGNIEGKSSIARTGLQIHCAGYIDPGFCGNVTVELVNFFDLPVILRPGVLIAQLSFRYLTEAARHPYNGRYQNSKGVRGSRYDPEGKVWDDKDDSDS